MDARDWSERRYGTGLPAVPLRACIVLRLLFPLVLDG